MSCRAKEGSPSLFDAHCHLQAARLIRDVDGVMERAASAGVAWMVCCGSIERDWEAVKDLSGRYAGVIPAFGLHPLYIEGYSEQWLDRLASFLKNGDAGIGEIGLDFMDKSADRELQEALFEKQLGLAKEMGLPVTIHVRKAWDAFIRIMKRAGELPAGGLIHSYSGSADMVPLFEKFGLCISFSGSVTRPNARKVPAALQAVSEDRLLIETDSPDILPTMPGRGGDEVNEPCNLPYIAGAAARILGSDAETVARRTCNNGVRLFSNIIEGREAHFRGEAR